MVTFTNTSYEKKKSIFKREKKKSKFEGAQEMTMNNDFEIESWKSLRKGILTDFFLFFGFFNFKQIFLFSFYNALK